MEAAIGEKLALEQGVPHPLPWQVPILKIVSHINIIHITHVHERLYKIVAQFGSKAT